MILYLNFRKQSRRLLRVSARNIDPTAELSAVLILALGQNQGSIKDLVKLYLQNEGIEYRFIEQISKAAVTPDNVPDILTQIRKLELNKFKNITTLHLFYNGPVSLAVLLGSQLQAFNLIVYQYDKKSSKVYYRMGSNH